METGDHAVASTSVEYRKDANSVHLTSQSPAKTNTTTAAAMAAKAKCSYCSRFLQEKQKLQQDSATASPSAASTSLSCCDCQGGQCSRQSPDPSIRLGAVPDSAFRSSSTNLKATEGGGYSSAATSSKTALDGGAAGDASGFSQAVQHGLRSSKYEIVSIREKHGDFRKAIPCMPVPVAVFLCLINVLAPGVGTLLSSFTVFCGCKTEHETKGRAFFYNIMAALLQLIMVPIVVGWVWSIMWGITFVNLSVTKALQDPITSNIV